ncbi:MAG: GNAT family N-acetyltransferase [Verrucomicrobia bacterium]|nr:GNAT family N-acetyltransferase [Verrucomicrobiota bacterium]
MDPARSVEDIHVRKANRKDFDFVLALSVETMQDELSPYEREHTAPHKLVSVMARNLRALMASSGMLTLVAETDDGRPAGFVMVGRSSSVFTDQQQAFVYDLAVASAFRRRGIGRLLMEHAEEHARRLKMGHIALMVDMGNAPARALYARLGFTDAKALMRKQLAE